MKNLLVIVDENDKELGALDKISIHQMGIMHRAFSLFIFNSNGELLLQKRSGSKYHSAGLWSNSCCSHPCYGETIPEAINRRLKEELDLECETAFKFSFVYNIQFENGLTENEFDHVYFGICDSMPNPDKREIQDWTYMSLEELESAIACSPEKFTYWLKLSLPLVIKHIQTDQNSLHILSESIPNSAA